MTAIDKNLTAELTAHGTAPARLRSWIVGFHKTRLQAREIRKLREMPRERLADMGIEPAATGAGLQGCDVGNLPEILIPGRMW